MLYVVRPSDAVFPRPSILPKWSGLRGLGELSREGDEGVEHRRRNGLVPLPPRVAAPDQAFVELFDRELDGCEENPDADADIRGTHDQFPLGGKGFSENLLPQPFFGSQALPSWLPPLGIRAVHL